MQIASEVLDTGLEQRRLFEDSRRIATTGAARYFIGDYFEQWASELLNAKRLKTTNAADICPDLRLRSRLYAEVKAAGRSNQVILYQERCQRYERFRRGKRSLIYVVFDHDVATSELQAVEDLAILKDRCRRMLIVAAGRLHKHLRSLPCRKVNGNRRGWTISLSSLRPFTTNQECFRQLEFIGFRGTHWG